MRLMSVYCGCDEWDVDKMRIWILETKKKNQKIKN